MALLVDILRPSTDSTMGGVTSHRFHRTTAILIGMEGSVPDGEVGCEDVVLTLVTRKIGGETYFHAEPVERNGRPMFGGNFVYSSDSRFRAVCAYPIPVHDRFE
jgi:hypothetical protein